MSARISENDARVFAALITGVWLGFLIGTMVGVMLSVFL